jgi:hypothetical protein
VQHSMHANASESCKQTIWATGGVSRSVSTQWAVWPTASHIHPVPTVVTRTESHPVPAIAMKQVPRRENAGDPSRVNGHSTRSAKTMRTELA